ILKVASEKDIYVITQTNLAIVMAVLLDSEKLSKKHLQELINQSQVELFEFEDNENNQEQETDFFE
ncbi:MAG: PTS fructose transporter subunit IIA, partial [Lactobacillus sp.]|nr:PTS fructose transporter subunit IIA [Lactobacillus sp.]